MCCKSFCAPHFCYLDWATLQSCVGNQGVYFVALCVENNVLYLDVPSFLLLFFPYGFNPVRLFYCGVPQGAVFVPVLFSSLSLPHTVSVLRIQRVIFSTCEHSNDVVLHFCQWYQGRGQN